MGHTPLYRYIHGMRRVICGVHLNTFTLVIIGVIVYILFALVSDISKSQIILNHFEIMPITIVPILASLLLLAIRFHRMLHALGIYTTIRKSIGIYFAGLSLLVTPAGAGQVIKSRFIKKEFGEAISKTSPIVLVETWSALSSVLIIVILFLLIRQVLEVEIIALIGSLFAILIAALVKNAKFFSIFKKYAQRIERLNKFETMIENSRSTCHVLMSLNMIVEGLILTIPAKLLEALCVFIIFESLGFKIDYILSTQVYFTSLVAGMLSFIPGGFVIVEGSMVAILAKYGYSLSASTVAVLLIRISTIWFATILGLITLHLPAKRQLEDV